MDGNCHICGVAKPVIKTGDYGVCHGCHAALPVFLEIQHHAEAMLMVLKATQKLLQDPDTAESFPGLNGAVEWCLSFDAVTNSPLAARALALERVAKAASRVSGSRASQKIWKELQDALETLDELDYRH